MDFQLRKKILGRVNLQNQSVQLDTFASRKNQHRIKNQSNFGQIDPGNLCHIHLVENLDEAVHQLLVYSTIGATSQQRALLKNLY